MKKFLVLSLKWICVLALLTIVACGNQRDNARKELDRLGIEYSEKSFLHRLRKGDAILTNLFLTSGMNPNARFLRSYDSTSQGELNEPTPLMIAARDGHSKLVRLLLSRGADVNALATNGQTALMYAARYAPAEVVESLIKKGANVNAKDEDGKTALTFAVLFDRLDIVKSLLHYKADVNARDRFHFTPLMQAAIKGRADIITVLLANGADLRAANDQGQTVLMLSAEYNRIEAVRIILKKGADIRVRDKKNRNALDIAKFEQHQTIIDLLTEASEKM
ncbi:ankyrin repeat domain-containing protein [bacterium]|nr:ankyrin repeat domain-containing protein [bacterium]